MGGLEKVWSFDWLRLKAGPACVGALPFVSAPRIEALCHRACRKAEVSSAIRRREWSNRLTLC